MMGLRAEEARAAAILAVVLDGSIVARDISGAPERCHDFDVVTGSGTIAVEVTSTIDPQALESARLVQKADWSRPELNCAWHLARRPAVPNVKALEKEIARLLLVLEQSGVGQFGVRELDNLPADVRAAVVRLSELGVVSGSSTGSDDRVPGIRFSWYSVGSTGPDLVNQAVEERASAKAMKLAAAGGIERHLFLWVDSTAFAVDATMSFDQLPQSSPTLPTGIDTVWVAPGPYVESGLLLTRRLWKVTASSGWRDVGEVRRSETEVPPIPAQVVD